MKKNTSISNLKIKQVISIILVLLIAFIVNHYFSFSKEGWIFISAFIVSQTTPGTPFKQNLIFFLTIVFSITIASIANLLPIKNVIEGINILIFVASAFILSNYQLMPTRDFFLMLLFPMLLLVTPLLAIQGVTLEARLLDVMIGTSIGIMGRQLMLVNFNKELKAGILPLINKLHGFSNELADGFIFNKNNVCKLYNKKIKIENDISQINGNYPEWIYEVGFNPGLRASYRFFLISLEQLIEVFFSFNNLLMYDSAKVNIQKLSQPIEAVLKTNDLLLLTLSDYLEGKKLNARSSDFMSDVFELEKSLKEIIPSQLELLGLSDNSLILIAIVRDLKDMRLLLLQLTNAIEVS